MSIGHAFVFVFDVCARQLHRLVRCSVDPMLGYYFPSAPFKTSFRALQKSQEAWRMVPGPIPNLCVHRTHRWKFIRIWKNVSHMCLHPESGVDVGIPPRWYDQMRELSGFIKFRAHTDGTHRLPHREVRACVCVHVADSVCVCVLPLCPLYHPAPPLCSFVAGGEKLFLFTDLRGFKLRGWEQHGSLQLSV